MDEKDVDGVFRRSYGIIASKLRCARQLVTVKSVSKRPQVYVKNLKGVTGYDLLLDAYDNSVIEMKKPRNEILQKDTLQQAKEFFCLTNELLELCTERYPIVRQRRLRFAVKMFAAEAIHYVIFLGLLVSMAFLSTNGNDQATFYFNKVITDTFDGGVLSNVADANGVFDV